MCIHCISTNIFNYVYIQIYKYVRQDRSLKINLFLASYCRYIYVQISIWNAILSTNLCMCVELAKIYIHNIRYIYDTLFVCSCSCSWRRSVRAAAKFALFLNVLELNFFLAGFRLKNRRQNSQFKLEMTFQTFTNFVNWIRIKF